MSIVVLKIVVLVCCVALTLAWTPHSPSIRKYHQVANFKLAPLKQSQHNSVSQPDKPYLEVTSDVYSSPSPRNWLQPVKTLWDFTRPHTIIGSCISIACLYLFAVPANQWKTVAFRKSLLAAMGPSLLMNLYITGLNQVTDIDIDKINKPYLPIAAGALSKANGIRVIMASLFWALYNVNSVAWPLRYTLIGSALLGTLYSLPPFRLKRFPLLAAFCILVVRGSLINMGFFLQAKVSVLGAKLAAPSSVGAAAALLGQVTRQYPEAVALTSFFAIFGVVIALMKDVPDVRGDVEYNIPSFSVKLGAAKMFRIAWGLLSTLLLTSSLVAVHYSQALGPFYAALSWVAPKLPIVGPQLTRFLAPLVVTGGVLSSSRTIPLPTQLVRVGLFAILSELAKDVQVRARLVETEKPDEVFAYYMHIWNIFYACYLMLPLLRI